MKAADAGASRYNMGTVHVHYAQIANQKQLLQLMLSSSSGNVIYEQKKRRTRKPKYLSEGTPGSGIVFNLNMFNIRLDGASGVFVKFNLSVDGWR
jgi:hypothetical protein